MQVDKDLSRRAARAIGAEVGQCYGNAYRALRDCPALAGALYVEGYAVGDLVLEHGWLELDGRIVDPTLGDGEALAYYPGLRFTLGELHTAMHTIPKTTGNEDLPIFYRLGWGGQDSPDMMTAAALAYDAADMPNLAQQYKDAARAALANLGE